MASFGPLEFRSESGAFRGGSVTTMFGGGEVDLRDATLDPAGRDAARQHAVRRREPRRAGGLERRDEPERDRRRRRHAARRSSGPPDAPTLRVEGTNWFGGWGITSTPHEDESLPEPVTV